MSDFLIKYEEILNKCSFIRNITKLFKDESFLSTIHRTGWKTARLLDINMQYSVKEVEKNLRVVFKELTHVLVKHINVQISLQTIVTSPAGSIYIAWLSQNLSIEFSRKFNESNIFRVCSANLKNI